MRALAAFALVLIGGCFLEGAAGVTPKMTGEITDASGTTTTSHTAWTVAVWLGFYYDYKGVGLGYSPLTNATKTYGSETTPDVTSDGHHLRLDIDLPLTRRIQTRATLSYTSVDDETIDASGNPTPMGAPDVNGKITGLTADGRSVFAGLSVAKTKRAVGFGATTSLGVSHLSMSSKRHTWFDQAGGGMAVPGISQSGTGVQLRVMIRWQPPRSWDKYMPDDEQMQNVTAPEPDERFLPTLDPKPDPVKCVDQYGTEIPC